MNYLFITSSRGGKMLQDSEGFKYYNKNGLYVCVDYKKRKSSCPKTLTYNENMRIHKLPKSLAITTMTAQDTPLWMLSRQCCPMLQPTLISKLGRL